MTGSVGAATAAMSRRGNRFFETDNEYEVILPSLPTGRIVFNTVFLHADVRARPYRVEDFRDALAHLKLLPDVTALGAYRMSHVWAVTFDSAHAVKKMLAAGEMQVKERRCLIIDPANQDVRMKIHWLLPGVPDEDVRAAFVPYGKVTDVKAERWRVQGVTDKGSTTRLVSLSLRAGVKLDDFPHQVSIAGELALVVVPGRAPLCLRFRGKGHVRRDCKIPRCGACRRFGHEESECARTYASVTGRSSNEGASDLMMDELDAEEAATAKGGNVLETLVPLSTSVAEGSGRLEPASSVLQDGLPDEKAAVLEDAAARPNEASENAESQQEEMVVSLAASSSQAGKRPREKNSDAPHTPEEGAEEPPAKAPGVRRPSFKPRPNVPPDPRQAAKPPP
ncbi:uncharacterized protein LOC144116391 [Amblyomma americanum]